MKACALRGALFLLFAATTPYSITLGSILLYDDYSCTGTACSSDGDTITFSIELVIVNPDNKMYLYTIDTGITSVTFLNPLTQRNETIQFKDHSYPLSAGVYCNNSYFTASKNDLKPFVKPFHSTPIPIYINYEDGSSVEKDVLVDAVIIGVSVVVGVIGLCCCLGIALQFWACIRKKAKHHHVCFTNAVTDNPVLIKAV
uniref:Uncharacterized protein n=1 Tax=Amphimedon queenslandica TaxID=400682 RepID=A0A1X7SUA9_AMPQE